jgi:hypothetical protein
MMQYAGKHVREMGESLTPHWVDRYLICITTTDTDRSVLVPPCTKVPKEAAMKIAIQGMPAM